VGGGADNAAVALLFHDFSGCPGTIKGTVEMGLHYKVPITGGNFVDRLDAENAGIIDKYVETAEFIESGPDDLIGTFFGSNAVIASYGGAAGLDDIGDHLVGSGGGNADAVM
jgi:hypothetical protein